MTSTAIQHDHTDAEQATAPVAIPLQNETAINAPEQQYRAGAYSLLAALLRNVPTQETLDRAAGLSGMQNDEDELATSMAMLGLAAQHSDRDSIDDEFHTLFIGLGRGELVPYGSWYLTGFLMEKPLGELRADLIAMGFERDPSVKEPEDHVAALCEVMSLLIQDGSLISTQSQFFSKHMSKWLDRFFDDLTHADSASFYQAVARFGAAFIAFERQYYGLEIQEID
uniref:Formate dehydrogenase-specific chaperone n=1 Tax=uncultured Thiotrichaceae bacterium TaxID=298394 RepID=A0A6S6UA33_9GAMM|nr:MAG: Putative formate dehydrogenase-specific chaperone [uncultured Thiotrichaceae bacterium]